SGETAELGGHQCFGAVGVSLVVDQSEKVPGKEKPSDLPPAIAQELVDLHCAPSDVEDVFRGVSFIEYRAMRLDIDGAHDRREAALFLAGQWGARRKLACPAGVARGGEMQRVGNGSSSQAEPRQRIACLISACSAMHRTTPAVSALFRRRHRRRGRI